MNAGETEKHAAGKPLESWKEIAAYIQRNEVTARRWEREEGLPVHRHPHKARSSVYAYPSEIDAWRASRRRAAEPARLWRPRALAMAATVPLCLVMVGNGLHPRAASAQLPEAMASRRVWEPPNIDARHVSPDGRYLVYTDWESGDLAVRDLVTSQTRRLEQGAWTPREATAYGEAAVVSPDGKQAAYTWFTEKTRYRSIRVIPMEQSGSVPEPRIIYHNADIEYAAPMAWSPDGREILASIQRKDQTWQLVFLPVSGGAERPFKSTGWEETRARLSPDGRYIAYSGLSRPDSGERDIFVLASDGSAHQTVVEHPADDLLLDWSPDGSALLFQSTRTGNWSLWMAPLKDGKAAEAPRLVKREMGRVQPLGITRNGAFYYSFLAEPQDVFISRVDLERGHAGQPEPVNPLALGEHAVPAWSADGAYLAYLGRRGKIVIRAESSGRERAIEPGIEMTLNRPMSWSADGRSLLVTGVDGKNRHGLYRVDVQSAAVTALVQPGFEHPIGVYSPDGSKVFYGGPHGVFAVDLHSRREEKISERKFLDTRICGLALSPDGKRLAIGSGGEDGTLEVMPAAGGEPRMILRKPGAFAALQWTGDGGHLLYRREGKIYRISAQGGQPQPLDVPILAGARGQFSIHPGGQRIAFAGGNPKVEVWVLENFLARQSVSR